MVRSRVADDEPLELGPAVGVAAPAGAPQAVAANPFDLMSGLNHLGSGGALVPAQLSPLEQVLAVPPPPPVHSRPQQFDWQSQGQAYPSGYGRPLPTYHEPAHKNKPAPVVKGELGLYLLLGGFVLMFFSLPFLSDEELGTPDMFFGIGILMIALGIVGSFCTIFAKAGEPGWTALVPVYRKIVLARIVGQPPIAGLILCIPFIGSLYGIIISLELARCFGRSALFGVGLACLPFIFGPILAYGSAEYEGC
jgi:hypothetical protein